MKEIEMNELKQFKGLSITCVTKIFAACLLVLALSQGCNKDQGNYEYKVLQPPVVTNFDSVYSVFVGDSLIIEPKVVDGDPEKTPALRYSWIIHVPPVTPSDTDLVFSGKDLRMAFGLGPQRFTGRFTMEDTLSGMKYFKDFIIVGKTAFVKGMTVLSADGDKSILTFIKPDDGLQPYIFEAVNPGAALPEQPTQILAVPVAYQPPVGSYWVFGKSGAETGIEIDANDFKVIKTLRDNFFDAPDSALQPQKIFVSPMGVISGVINGVLYNGTTSTWNEAPTYGMFGQGAVGDYNLSPEAVFNYNNNTGAGNYIGFDMKSRGFVRFNLYGDATYFGNNYTVEGNAFDPKNVGMDLVHLQQISGGLCYGYFRAADDSLYECRMNTSFDGPFEIKELQKRPFIRQDLISATTLWQATENEILYFSAGDIVYRYNPLNQDLKPLSADFKGKQVTMVKLMDQQTLVVAADGALNFLDIRTGKNGVLLKRIEGIPGKIVDMAFREQ